MKLLCISNGHGEDVIALRILSSLQQCSSDLDISALPISGTGSAYRSHNISIIGSPQALPSGGFLNRDIKQLTKDVRKGLLALTQQQLRAIKHWRAHANPTDPVLAVGDIVPLLFAHLSKQPYHFIGTAKSEYWLRDERGKLPPTSLISRLEGWSGSVYLPWERWLMSSDRCQSIFVRDALSAQQLQKLGISADYAGNPMMDDLEPTGKLAPLLNPLSEPHPSNPPLTIALLPGSRQPEAYQNWTRILTTIPSLLKSFPTRPLILLAAIAPSLSSEALLAPLPKTWQPTQISSNYPTFSYKNVTLALINDAYSDCLHSSDIAIATAGTATEQFVGLGKPALTLPGPGPQFTQTFATVQAKMLGPSIEIVNNPNHAGKVISATISDPDRLQLIYQNGIHRMGEPEAGKRIAQKLFKAINDKIHPVQ